MAENKARNHCSVPTCTNNSSRQSYLSFHSFPTDVHLRKKWICAIRRDEGEHFKILRGSTYVCSQHFKESDYSKTTGRKRLKHGAVPSRFQWTNPGSFARRNYFGLRKARSMRGMNAEKLPDHAYAAVSPPAGGNTSSLLGHTIHMDQNSSEEFERIIVKEEEPEDKDNFSVDTSGSVGCAIAVDQLNEEFLRITVKEEEPEDEEYQGGATSSLEGTDIPVDQQNGKYEMNPVKNEPKDDSYLFCEHCRTAFINKCEVHGPALFIPDTPVPVGCIDRARQTLPHGLELQMSAIPNAGLGVFNKGETVPVGAHFGPYEGDVVDREEVINSGYSWVIKRNTGCEKYIDGKRELHSNWMRYVNCSHNSEDNNLVAFQYRGRILYRCCRPIHPGQELLLWYEEEYARHLGLMFDDFWNIKSSLNAKSNSFYCSWCPLFYTSEIHLGEHIKKRHCEEVKTPQKTAETPSSISQQTLSGPRFMNTSDAPIQKKVFQCSECEKSFSHQSNFQIHTRVHTGEKPYQCSECGKSFTQQNNLQSHQHIHTGEKPYRCSQCGKSFNREDNLRIHRRIHTGEKPYCCGVCTKSFAHRSALQIHHRVHTGEKPYQCPQCAKSFTQLTHLQQHKLTHNREKPYQCLSCRKCFTQQCYLQAHQRIHTGEKPYCCTQCGKTFTHQSTLRRHGRVHTGEKLYQCSQCAKSFSHKSTFQIHQRTHTGEKPCECSECGKRFTHQQALLLHQRTHTGEKPYHCSECEKSFRSQSHLQRHQRTHTREETYHCLHCGRSFCYASTFKTHKCVGMERSAAL
ncbi:hypothetical protein QTP86_016802 [Hemibagrus guttatus]|nr:hypothetical protein QTP86_016802 [Hemibagrus guttatus]